MALKIGNITPSKLYLGSTEIQKAYLGSNLVWDKTGGGFDADYQAVLDYATTQGYTLPSASQQALQNQLVLDLKSGGIWSKLDIFYTFATDGDSDFATLNWKAPSNYQITKVNSPTFTTNDGFKGDGTTSYLGVPFQTANDAVNFQADSAGFFMYVNEAPTIGVEAIGYTSASGLRIMVRASAANQQCNTNNSQTDPDFSGTGLRSVNKTASQTLEMFAATTQTSSVTTANSAMVSEDISLLARISNNSFSNTELSVFGLGDELVSENTDLNTALNDYMTSI